MKYIWTLLLVVSFSLQSCNETKTAKQIVETQETPQAYVVTDQQPSTMALLTPQEFEAVMAAKPDLQLVDVRTVEEFSEGHLVGAKNIVVTEPGFAEKMEAMDRTQAIYVYCKSGGRSGRAAKALKEMGFKEIYDLEGGITAWNAAGLTTE